MKSYADSIQRPWEEFDDPYEKMLRKNQDDLNYVPDYDPQSNPNRRTPEKGEINEINDYFDNPYVEDY